MTGGFEGGDGIPESEEDWLRRGAVHFQEACGAECAYLGWTTTVYPFLVTDPADGFFETLSHGSSINTAMMENLPAAIGRGAAELVPEASTNGNQTIDTQ